MGVAANFGAKVDGRKWAVRFDPDVMKNVSTKEGNKGDRVSLKIGNAGE